MISYTISYHVLDYILLYIMIATFRWHRQTQPRVISAKICSGVMRGGSAAPLPAAPAAPAPGAEASLGVAMVGVVLWLPWVFRTPIS